MKINRKQFLNYLLSISGLGAAIAVFFPVFSYLIPPKGENTNVTTLKVGLNSEMETDSSKMIKFGRIPVILIKTKQNELKALSATCTHLDCIVQYKKETSQIWCACHNGTYDLSGNNVSGPPPRPLTQYAVKVINDEIIISQQG